MDPTSDNNNNNNNAQDMDPTSQTNSVQDMEPKSQTNNVQDMGLKSKHNVQDMGSQFLSLSNKSDNKQKCTRKWVGGAASRHAR